MKRAVPSPSRALLIGVPGVMLGLLVPGSAAAQTLVGRVVEDGTRQPLAGAFVQLVDEAGSRAAGVLTDSDGEFRVRADAGSYRVVVELIGYAGATASAELSRGETARLEIEVPVRAVSLGSIRAEVDRRCHRRPGQSAVTQRLWEEARKALEVASWADGRGLLRFQIVEHERELSARTSEVLSQTERRRRVLGSESPYQSVEADRVARAGYVQRRPDGSWDYFAPDADVLLSDSFLESHCFRVVASPSDEPELIGLGIEPVPERDLPEIEGVLWLEEATAELRRLEFTYVNLPYTRESWPEVGGRVEFERLATGLWIVRRWHVRMPLQAVRRRSGEVALVTLVQQGAEIEAVHTPDGERLATSAGATLHGRVLGPDGDPLPDATVAVLAADARTRTGADGAYRIRELPEGRWAVNVAHPDIGGAGLPPVQETIRLHAGRAARLDVRIGPDTERARTLCAMAGWSEAAEPVVVHGRVTAAGDTAGVPAWVQLRVGNVERRVRSDGDGGYRICVPPARQPAYVTAARDSAALPWDRSGVEARIAEPGFVRLDVTVPRSP